MRIPLKHLETAVARCFNLLYINVGGQFWCPPSLPYRNFSKNEALHVPVNHNQHCRLQTTFDIDSSLRAILRCCQRRCVKTWFRNPWTSESFNDCNVCPIVHSSNCHNDMRAAACTTRVRDVFVGCDVLSPKTCRPQRAQKVIFWKFSKFQKFHLFVWIFRTLWWNFFFDEKHNCKK